MAILFWILDYSTLKPPKGRLWILDFAKSLSGGFLRSKLLKTDFGFWIGKLFVHKSSMNLSVAFFF
ncbi:hypothetical protein B4U84_19810 [Westiellopsis prolifica IICB1]|nr:hypothetical protein B4U84_19810 [Westiellopsis prolifica IICB1]